jgi:predicted adenylyl cyclase CyaB
MEHKESITPLQQEVAPNKKAPKEIERKFLVKSLPENLNQYPRQEISQGYVSVSKDGVEVRLRKEGDKYFQTIKSGGGKIRIETEIEISEEQFNSLWQTTEGKRLEKVRYEIPHGGQIIEADVYRGSLEGLVSAEIEFASPEASDQFVPPEWFGKDVTGDKRYKNQSLALRGLPKEAAPKKEREKEKLDIPEYGLEEGVAQLVSMAREKVSQRKGPIIIEVAGGSASGKTSAVAAKLKEIFGEEAMIVAMDDYYRGKTFMETEAQKGNVLNWDQPEALNLPLLREHLSELKTGRSIQKPIYSFKTGEPTGTEELQPCRVIIVEGLFALDEVMKDEGDVKVFVEIGTHGRILRRLLRDIERTGQKPADILGFFAEVVEPMHEKYVASTKRNADIIVINEYSPKVEAERSGLHEVQLKFPATLDVETLRKIGAERLGAVTQVDTYYNPRDRNLVETGEILRIREEGDHKILTYKGPKIESKFRERPKFEFEIDTETERKFLSMYGDSVKVIKKERVLYQLDGIVFSVDSVFKIENDVTIDLGNFIEIRSASKGGEKPKLDEALAKLGLDVNQGIKESYFEM